jgi:hypothetical protein
MAVWRMPKLLIVMGLSFVVRFGYPDMVLACGPGCPSYPDMDFELPWDKVTSLCRACYVFCVQLQSVSFSSLHFWPNFPPNLLVQGPNFLVTKAPGPPKMKSRGIVLDNPLRVWVDQGAFLGRTMEN